MAVTDLWHKRGEVGPCPLCGQQAGPPSARHGRGLRWRVAVPGHRSEGFAQKGAAERRERALWAMPRPTGAGETVGDMVRVWLDGKAGLTRKGLESAQYGAQVVLARWEHVPLDAVDADDVRAWIGGLSTPQGPASLSARTKALQCLKGSLAIAVRRGLLAAHPADGVTVPPMRVREGRALTVAEAQRLAAAMDERYRAVVPTDGVTPYGAMLWLMMTAGPRIGEVLALDVGHVDAKRRRVRLLTTKGGRPRNLPVAAEVLALLDLDRPKSKPLFEKVRGGGRITQQPWRARWFNPAARSVGLDVSPHDLRHTAVSWAIDAGASIHDVQEMCGHSKPSITWDIYGHLMDGHLDDVAARMGARIRGLPGKDCGERP